MRLWIEHAHQSLVRSGGDVCGDVVRTFQTEEQFFAVLASGPRGRAEGRTVAARVVKSAAGLLEQRAAVEAVVETVLTGLPQGEHVPFALLQVLKGGQARVVECDAPPLFMTRGGRLVLPPVIEEVSHGRLVRECQFILQDGDHLAMVSEGYIRAKGWSRRWGWRDIAVSIRRWGWRDIAVSIRRWTDTGCDAEELLGALIRMYHRLVEGEPDRDVSVVAMRVRPARTATLWTGPPADPAMDEAALNKLMAEPGIRIICGGTTAQIAARLLNASLEVEPRPNDGWAGVPPTSRLEGVDLVTEGVVTLTQARERLAQPGPARDRPSSRSRGAVPAPGLGEAQSGASRRRVLRGEDGATRLARALLAADRIHVIVGLAINPAQAADVASTVTLRREVVEELTRDLEARGKLVSVDVL